MRLLIILAVISAVLLNGCSARKERVSEYDKKSELARSTVVKGADIPAAMQKCRDELGSMGFKFDKYDIENGYLRTEPLSGSQFFEIWRGDDNVGSYNAAMANINSIARVVEMHFKSAEASVYIDCRADVRRLSVATGDIAAASDMKEVFTDTSSGFQELTLKDANAQWVYLGRDVMLEDKILFIARK